MNQTATVQQKSSVKTEKKSLQEIGVQTEWVYANFAWNKTFIIKRNKLFSFLLMIYMYLHRSGFVTVKELVSFTTPLCVWCWFVHVLCRSGYVWSLWCICSLAFFYRVWSYFVIICQFEHACCIFGHFRSSLDTFGAQLIRFVVCSCLNMLLVHWVMFGERVPVSSFWCSIMKCYVCSFCLAWCILGAD